MSVKAWVKAPGAEAVLSEGWGRDIRIGPCVVRLRARAGMAASQLLLDNWPRLESQAEASLFLAWPWIDAWLAEVVGERQVIAIEVLREDALVALAVVTLFERRILGKQSRIAFLNELPLPGHNMVVEKNGVLARQGHEADGFHAVVAALAASNLGIEEIRCSAVDSRYLSAPTLSASFLLLYENTARCWLIGKVEARLSRDDLLATFSKSRRGQIGRFLRRVESEYGPLSAVAAQSEEQARAFFERLESLHTAYWQAQGQPGSFTNGRWKAFHWRLIQELLPTGRLQLLRVTAGDEELGYLYNIGQGSIMSNIQSGFVYRDDNRWRPGYLSHLVAAEAAAGQGYRHYDLLMGDDEYKASIARPGACLNWVSLFPERGAALFGGVNRRRLLRSLLELYRWIRTSSKPKAQGDSRS